MNVHETLLAADDDASVVVVRSAARADDSLTTRDAILADAIECLSTHGIVILENAIPTTVIAKALDYFKRTYDSYVRPGQARLFRNFQDDPRRAQIPVAAEGSLANPLLYANPLVMQIVQRVIGAKAVIGEMGGVISHPGAEAQYAHRDSEFLYGGIPEEINLPPASLSVFVPLIDVPVSVGPTEFWPGSHKVVEMNQSARPQRVPLKAGSLSVWDARLLHRGGPNRSDTVRPAVYITYQRPWYTERFGYEGKPQVRITPAMLSKLPEEHRPLFSWALHLNRSDSFDEFLMRWVGRIKTRFARIHPR